MDNPELGREVLDVADYDAEHFSMSTWGYLLPDGCGTVSCLAGTAMLKSGYRIRSYLFPDVFIRPDGSVVENNGREAVKLLGMTEDEVYGVRNLVLQRWDPPIWSDFISGVQRFREIVERAEKERDNAR